MASLTEVKSVLKSLLVSSPKPISIFILNEDYKRFEGIEIPYKRFGFNSLMEMLLSIPDAVQVVGSGMGAQVIAVINNSNSQTISNFKSLNKNDQSHQRRRGNRSSMHRSMQEQTGGSNFNKWNNGRQHFNKKIADNARNHSSKFSNADQVDVGVTFNKGNNRQQNQFNQKTNDNTNNIMRKFSNACQVDVGKKVNDKNNDYTSTQSSENDSKRSPNSTNKAKSPKLQFSKLKKALFEIQEKMGIFNQSKENMPSANPNVNNEPNAHGNEDMKYDQHTFNNKKEEISLVNAFFEECKKRSSGNQQNLEEEKELYPADVLKPKEKLQRQWIGTDVKINDCIDIYVSEIYDVSNIWVVLFQKECYGRMKIMMRHMQEFYSANRDKHLIKDKTLLYIGLHCVVLKNEYTRAIIISTFTGDKNLIKVFCVDLGTIAFVELDKVFFLNKGFSAVPAQAIKVKIAGLIPGKTNFTSNSRAIQILNELLYHKFLVGKIKAIDTKNQVLDLELFNTYSNVDVNIREELIKEKIAVQKLNLH